METSLHRPIFRTPNRKAFSGIHIILQIFIKWKLIEWIIYFQNCLGTYIYVLVIDAAGQASLVTY